MKYFNTVLFSLLFGFAGYLLLLAIQHEQSFSLFQLIVVIGLLIWALYDILKLSRAESSENGKGVNVDDEIRGLYNKYNVIRIDGSDAPDRKHEGCKYFVLDVDCDPHAIPALMAYVAACKNQYPALAADMRKTAQFFCEHRWTDTFHGPDTVGEHCAECGVNRDADYSEAE